MGFSSLENETTQSANAHLEYIGYVLELFNKSIENVVCLIGDNCSVNRSLAKRIGIGFIGCASHRWNLAMKDVTGSSDLSISKVEVIMKAFRRPKLAGKLRKLTHLKAKCPNATRWSSTVQMLDRYTKLRSFLSGFDEHEFGESLLTPHEEKRIDSLCEKYSELESITKASHRESTTMSEV